MESILDSTTNLMIQIAVVFIAILFGAAKAAPVIAKIWDFFFPQKRYHGHLQCRLESGDLGKLTCKIDKLADKIGETNIYLKESVSTQKMGVEELKSQHSVLLERTKGL